MLPVPFLPWRNHGRGSIHTSPCHPTSWPTPELPLDQAMFPLARQLGLEVFPLHDGHFCTCTSHHIWWRHIPGTFSNVIFKNCFLQVLRTPESLQGSCPLSRRSHREGIPVSHFSAGCLALTRPSYIRQDPNFPFSPSCFHPPSDSLFWNRSKQEQRLSYLNKLLGLLNLFLSLFLPKTWFSWLWSNVRTKPEFLFLLPSFSWN